MTVQTFHEIPKQQRLACQQQNNNYLYSTQSQIKHFLFYNVFSLSYGRQSGSYLIRLHIVCISINLQLWVRIIVDRTNGKHSM